MVETGKKHLLLADDLEDDFTTTSTKTSKIKREKLDFEEDGREKGGEKKEEYKNEPAGWFWKNVLEPSLDKLANDQDMPMVNSLTELQKVFLQIPAAAGLEAGEDWEKVILALFEGTLHEKLMAPLKKKETPLVIILAASGQRCADLIRCLPNYQKKCKIAKCFAKHFKVQQQVAYLTNTPVRIAIGTPNRIKALIEHGALSVEQTMLWMVDMRLDLKQRRLWNIPELQKDALTLFQRFAHQQQSWMLI